ncbi:MAG TPA: ankyrin repeat domain-containing protein [Candidatus Binatia bacterium]
MKAIRSLLALVPATAAVVLLAFAGRGAADEPGASATPLRDAIDAHERSAFAAAILGGADWHEAGLGDADALVLAAAADSPAAVRYLVSRGVAVDAPGTGGTTALFAAAAAGAVDAAKTLIELGADPDARVQTATAPSWTPLFAAVDNGREVAAGLLLAAPRRDGDRCVERVDAIDRYGRTPMFYAALSGQSLLAILLIDRGADLSIRDRDGATARDLAEAAGRSDLVSLLDAAKAAGKSGPVR